jgi:hypothetical protein
MPVREASDDLFDVAASSSIVPVILNIVNLSEISPTVAGASESPGSPEGGYAVVISACEVMIRCKLLLMAYMSPQV